MKLSDSFLNIYNYILKLNQRFEANNRRELSYINTSYSGLTVGVISDDRKYFDSILNLANSNSDENGLWKYVPERNIFTFDCKFLPSIVVLDFDKEDIQKILVSFRFKYNRLEELKKSSFFGFYSQTSFPQTVQILTDEVIFQNFLILHQMTFLSKILSKNEALEQIIRK